VLGIAVVAGLGLISFTPLSEIWFQRVAGLSPTLSEFFQISINSLHNISATTVIINFQRAILVYSRKTEPITYATIIEVAGIILTLIIAIKFFSVVGVVAAVIAYILGRTRLFLFNHTIQDVRRKEK